jgi:hypothetical protein
VLLAREGADLEQFIFELEPGADDAVAVQPTSSPSPAERCRACVAGAGRLIRGSPVDST